ncbi:MAG: DUF5596 domain-containing protein [Clostridia bacterium]|nr:DUF5596 domain-containing protein [Clostridia bacterium]
MNVKTLCEKISMPEEVTKVILSHESVMTQELELLLSSPKTWEEGVKELRVALGEDEYGLKSLAECILLAAKRYDAYREKGISDEIYFATMAFCTRFTVEHRKIYGKYAFRWTWWFVRQLAMKEFRVGELEFEFTEGKIYIHIPADADMRPASIDKTFASFRAFLETYDPKEKNTPWYCESWMLSPVLERLLPETSNVLAFQRRFEIEFVEESMAVLDWVFPGEKELSSLSERTSLQRNMKRFLLAGGNVGWAEGKLKSGF